MTRCFGDGDPIYAEYHDTEWGVAPTDFGEDESELFERLSLEVFQVGLSWLLILRRREAFREVFHDFDPAKVATMISRDVDRLAGDERIVRNRRKIEATINNAKQVLRMHEGGERLAELFAAHRPSVVRVPRAKFADVPAFTDESAALAKALKARGFSFVGPTNVYAMMQALGIVDDHVATCPIARERGAIPGTHAPDVWDEVREHTGARG